MQLYCYTFQAERSLAFALGAPWNEFREYYQGEQRLAGVKRLRQRVQDILEHYQVTVTPITREEFGRNLPSFGLFRYLFGRWISNRKKYWSFSSQEISFAALTLNSLVNVLETSGRPDQEFLISLRMDLCSFRSMLEERCYGLAEIHHARWLEHFWQAD